MNKHAIIYVAAGLMGLTACGGDNYSQSDLNAARAALPSRAMLTAPDAQSSGVGRAIGEPAVFPTNSHDLVEGVNGTVGALVDTLEFITDLPPTIYNSETEEFAWGPFENDEGVGYVTVYVGRADPSEDFEWNYAFVRGLGPDLANTTVVIAGGGTPDPTNDDFGSGVALFDFDANNAFDEANDPTYDANTRDRGRFITVFGTGPDADAPENTVTIVLAVFRNFVSNDNPQATPVDLDYLYGHYTTADWEADFLNYESTLDVSDPLDGTGEDISVKLALINGGSGRAEVSAGGGSLAQGESVTGVECWDDSINQTYIRFDGTGGAAPWNVELGNATACGPLFSTPLDDLDIPDLSDVEPEELQLLSDIATNGIQF